MKFFLLLALLLPMVAQSQNIYPDTTAAGFSQIMHSKSHGKMVSFTQWYLGDLKPFWSYMLNELNYKTGHPENGIEYVSTKTGAYVELFKYSDNQEKMKMRVNFVCKGDGTEIKLVTITAPFNLLVELYLFYFQATAKDYLPKKGGIDKMYTITDEVRLYLDSITITARGNTISSE